MFVVLMVLVYLSLAEWYNLTRSIVLLGTSCSSCIE